MLESVVRLLIADSTSIVLMVRLPTDEMSQLPSDAASIASLASMGSVRVASVFSRKQDTGKRTSPISEWSRGLEDLAFQILIKLMQ